MTTRKKRRATAKVKPPAVKRRKLKPTFIKPPGIRVEDVKAGTVFKFTLDDDEEVHLALASGFSSESTETLNTWCLSGKDKSPCADMLPGKVDWDYKIEILGMVDSADIAKKIIRACKKK